MAQGLIHPAGEPENAVLPDTARLVRWVGPAFVLFSVVMVPWTIYLGHSLPARQDSPHNDIAWAGFDVLLLVVLASTGYFAMRRSAYLATRAGSARHRCSNRSQGKAAHGCSSSSPITGTWRSSC